MKLFYPALLCMRILSKRAQAENRVITCRAFMKDNFTGSET
jgi:hypothetical protein